jgi:hypothetical protein
MSWNRPEVPEKYDLIGCIRPDGYSEGELGRRSRGELSDVEMLALAMLPG